MQKKQKGFIYTVLLFLIFAVPAYAEAMGDIPDGKYAVSATLLAAGSDEASRLNNALVNPLNVVVEKGKTNVYLTLSRSEKELNTLKVSRDGGKNYTEASVISASEGATQYMFSVDHLEDTLFATIYVDAMGASPLFRIAFNQSDVEKIKRTAEEEKPKQEEPVKEAAVKTTPQAEQKPVGQKTTAAAEKEAGAEAPAAAGGQYIEDPEVIEENEAEVVVDQEDQTGKTGAAGREKGDNKIFFLIGGGLILIGATAGRKILIKK